MHLRRPAREDLPRIAVSAILVVGAAASLGLNLPGHFSYELGGAARRGPARALHRPASAGDVVAAGAGRCGAAGRGDLRDRPAFNGVRRVAGVRDAGPWVVAGGAAGGGRRNVPAADPLSGHRLEGRAVRRRGLRRLRRAGLGRGDVGEAVRGAGRCWRCPSCCWRWRRSPARTARPCCRSPQRRSGGPRRRTARAGRWRLARASSSPWPPSRSPPPRRSRPA